MLWWWADLLLVRGEIVVIAFAIEGAVAGHHSLGLLMAAALMLGLGLPIFLRGVRRELTRQDNSV